MSAGGPVSVAGHGGVVGVAALNDREVRGTAGGLLVYSRYSRGRGAGGSLRSLSTAARLQPVPSNAAAVDTELRL